MEAFMKRQNKEDRRVGNRKRRRMDDDVFEELGGYMKEKLSKLEDQYEEESRNFFKLKKISNIFKGISIYASVLTDPGPDDLKILMFLHGGTFDSYYITGKTTYVVANNLPIAKIYKLKSAIVVKPEWVLESIQARKLLDYKKYLVFSQDTVFKTEDKKDSNDETKDNETLPDEGLQNEQGNDTLPDEGLQNEQSNDTLPDEGLQNEQSNDTLPDEGLQNEQGNEEKNEEIHEHPAPEKSVAKTAADPRFLSQFYSKSRLHHLSKMGSMCKQYVEEVKEKHNGIFQGRIRISDLFEEGKLEKMKTEIPDNVIFHIDMDCFFVSVYLRNHPELKGKPVAVSHSRGSPIDERFGTDTKFEYRLYKKKMETQMGMGHKESDSVESDDGEPKLWLSEFSSRSEVASCSYEARAAGVSNGMYLGRATKLCPNLEIVPYDFEGYKEVSDTLYNTICEYTLDIEAVSCDELYIDATSLLRDMQMKPLDFATMLRNDIRERTDCPSSIGIGSNKLQARLATKRAKPDGQFYLQPDEVMTFMSDVNVYDLPGVGRTIGYKLKTLNVKTCLDLQNVPLATLKLTFGEKKGDSLYKHSRGIDETPVNNAQQRKSVSAEVNYGIRFVKEEEAINFLKQLSLEVSNRLRDLNMKGKNVTLKVMIRAKDAPAEAPKFMGHGVCDYTTRSLQLPYPSDDAEFISKHVISIYQNLSVPPSELRGLGIQITKLESSRQAGGALDKFLKPKKAEKKKGSTSKSLKEPSKDADRIVLPSLTQIDPTVLGSLPKELQDEILNEYSSMDKSPKQKSRLRQLKKAVDNVAGNQSKAKGTKKSSLKEISLSEMRNMITEWVSTQSSPIQCDIDMLKSYVSDLIYNKQTENVDILLKCFRRCINNKYDGKESWIECFREVVSHVQASMTAVFDEETNGKKEGISASFEDTCDLV